MKKCDVPKLWQEPKKKIRQAVAKCYSELNKPLKFKFSRGLKDITVSRLSWMVASLKKRAHQRGNLKLS